MVSRGWPEDFGAGFVTQGAVLRIGRYIGETCNVKDGLVKVLPYECETALSDSSGGRGRRDLPPVATGQQKHGTSAV